MKNITVSVDEETHRMARIRAAELETSVSALVREYLRSLVGDDESRTSSSELDLEKDDFERKQRSMNDAIEQIRANGGGLRMSDNLSREELYDRDRARTEAEMERRRGLSV